MHNIANNYTVSIYDHTQGNVGILDATTQSYTTLVRSHVGHVTSIDVSQHSPGHLVSCSEDCTIKVWDLPSGPQVWKNNIL